MNYDNKVSNHNPYTDKAHKAERELLKTENLYKAIMETDLDLQTWIFPQSAILEILHFLKSLLMDPSFTFIIYAILSLCEEYFVIFFFLNFFS